MHKCFLILILLFGIEDIYGQLKYPQNLYFNRLTVNNGLSQSANTFIYKDSKDYVWLSSTSGLNRFDGYNVKIYRESPADPHSIKGANINGLFCEASNSDIWFSTFSAINHYIRKEDRFEHYHIIDSSGQELNEYFTCGLSSKGVLWLIHNQSVYRFDTIEKSFHYVTELKFPYLKAKTIFNKDGSIKYLIAYYHDNINGMEIIQFDRNEKFTSHLVFNDAYSSDQSPFRILEVSFDSDNLDLSWITTNRGLMAFNNESKNYNLYPLIKEGIFFTPRGIDNYNENYLFISSYSGGFCFFDKKSRKPLKFYTNQKSNFNYEIISNNGGTVYVDKDKGIWLDIPGVSVEYSYPKKQKFIHKLNLEEIGSIPTFRSIVPLPDSTYWVGSFNDRSIIFNEGFEIIDILSSANYNDLNGNPGFYHFIDNINRVWHCGWGGLLYYDLERKMFNPVHGKNGQPLPAMIFGFTLKDSSVIFSAVTGGLYKLASDTNNNLFLQKITDKKLHGAYPIVYKSNNGFLYASQNLSHLIKLDEQLNKIKTVSLNADLRSFYEFPNDSIMWIGSNQGLIAYNKKNDTYKIYTEKDGLPNALIFGIVGEGKNLWLSTANGLAKVNTENFSITSFSVYDGIAYPEFNSHSYLKKPNGQILFGSLIGVTTFHPNDIQPTAYNSNPQITDIKINDETKADLTCNQTKATNLSEIQSLRLPFADNTLSFEFSAMDYGDPKNNQYKYRLLNDGKETPWIESGTRNFARFANIEAGQHQFQLLAANSDGNWSKQPKVLDIYIIPPLLQRTWFRILLIALFAGLLWLASRIYYNIKFGKQIALERQKLFWARKMHEDLGADYSSLKIRLGLLFDQITGNKVSAKDTQRIKELSETVGKQIRGITWSLNYKNDTLDKLINYLQEYAVKRFEDTGIDLTFPVADDTPDHKISGEHRMTVLHVFKEALNNIHKHAQANKVTISPQFNDTQASILIKDNGQGFDPELLLQSNGNGLKNMRERMEEIGGSCTIKTDQQGTSVRISFAL